MPLGRGQGVAGCRAPVGCLSVSVSGGVVGSYVSAGWLFFALCRWDACAATNGMLFLLAVRWSFFQLFRHVFLIRMCHVACVLHKICINQVKYA